MLSQFLLCVRLISNIRTGMWLLVLVVMAVPCEPVSAKALPARESFSLTGMFLVASDDIRDPRFARSVLLIARHDSRGAIALMINHPTRVLLSRALPDIAELADSTEKLFIGGPMKGAPYMLLFSSAERLPSEASKLVFDNVYFSTDADLIPVIMGQSDGAFRVYSGFARWAPGQLEGELERGGWHLESADPVTIFEKAPSSIWPDLSSKRGSLKWINHACEIDDCSAPGDDPLTNSVY
jgi:putative transcriptional regulator